VRPLVFAAVLLVAAGSARPDTGNFEAFPITRFESRGPAEAVVRLTVQCDRCQWDVAGREGATLALTVDTRKPIHLPIVRSGSAEYVVLLGAVEAGSHTLRIEVNPDLTAPALRAAGVVEIANVRIEQQTESDPAYVAVSLSPIVHARPNTVGQFTDVPVFMWYETEPAGIGTRYRYSVVFTNEDGGTPTDRLMATWGRTTDIEYIYSVVVDASGRILAEDYQGPEHVITPFGGTREGRHPLLWVCTHNNMVCDKGEPGIRYAPAPQYFPLRNVSREAVMDANPWLYEVMTRELVREGKIVPDAPPGKNVISDPRRFVYIEACGDLGNSALAFAVRAGGEWIPSDRGVPEYRIVRNGCFRAAIPLPDSVKASDVRALRAQAFVRPERESDRKPVPVPPRDSRLPTPPPRPTPVRLARINRVFMLDEQYRPGPTRLQWEGEEFLFPTSKPLEFVLQ
jgi:hypothetical protein